jgi:hypothetical protein
LKASAFIATKQFGGNIEPMLFWRTSSWISSSNIDNDAFMVVLVDAIATLIM